MAEGSGGSNESATGPDVISGISQLDTNRVPLPVLYTRRGVAQIVLAAQFVGDARRRGLEITRAADDLRAAAAVVGDVAERRHVHPFVAAATAAPRHRWRIRRRGPWRRHPPPS